MVILRAKLANLSTEFDDRQDWWDERLAEAQQARDAHRKVEALNAAQLGFAKKNAGNWSRGIHKIEKYGRGVSEKLVHQHSILAGHNANAVRIEGAIVTLATSSASLSGSRLYGQPFWDKFEEAIKQGKHGKASRLLHYRETWLNRALMTLTGGTGRRDAFMADIKQARELLASHKDVYEARKEARKELNKSAKDAAKVIKKLLLDPQTQRLLRTVAPTGNPELDLMISHAASGKLSLKSLQKDIKALGGGFDLNRLRAQMGTLARNETEQIRTLRRSCAAAGDRVAAVDRFIHSCRTAQDYETKTSLVAGHRCKDMAEALAGADKLDEAKGTKLAHAAEVKKRRWLNPDVIHQQIIELQKPDFAAGHVNSPHNIYRAHAVIDSVYHGKEMAAAAAASSWRTVKDKFKDDPVRDRINLLNRKNVSGDFYNAIRQEVVNHHTADPTLLNTLHTDHQRRAVLEALKSEGLLRDIAHQPVASEAAGRLKGVGLTRDFYTAIREQVVGNHSIDVEQLKFVNDAQRDEVIHELEEEGILDRVDHSTVLPNRFGLVFAAP